MGAKRSGRIPTKQVQLLRASFPQQCAACGATDNLTLDHIVARALGGSNQRSNLQLLCRACNQAKARIEQKQTRAA